MTTANHRNDGLLYEQLQDRRRFLATAVGAEYFGRIGRYDHEPTDDELNIYSYHGSWLDLINDLTEASDWLANAVEEFDSPDVDLILTVENFVTALIDTNKENGYWLSTFSQLPEIARKAVTE